MIEISSGLTILALRSFREIDQMIDTLLIAGGMEVWSGSDQPEMLRWIQERAQKARRYGSICTGAFVLAQAGLLQGKRVTTHWYFCQQLQRDYPGIIVDLEPIFI